MSGPRRSLGIGRTDHDPSGKPASASRSPRNSADSGVRGAGFTMIGAPTASAGATLWATRLSGKLKGVMPSTGPRGKRRVSASRPSPVGSVSSLVSSPAKRRASSAPQRKVELARATSARDQVSGLPLSAVMRRASSSPRRAISFDTAASAPARTWAGSAANAGATAAAAATAVSTWSGSGCATTATSAPSNGCRTVVAAGPVAGLPASQNGVGSLIARMTGRRGRPSGRLASSRLPSSSPSSSF